MCSAGRPALQLKKSTLMKIFFYLPYFFLATACTGTAQEKKALQHVAFCTEKKGCQVAAITMPAAEVDKLLGKSNFWTTAAPNATLILQNCESAKDEKRSLAEIHHAFGGSGTPGTASSADLSKYLREKGCLTCPNATKKISFWGKTNEGKTLNTYFFLNLRADEAYMPNEAFKQMGLNSGEGGENVIINQFLRNNVCETYMISEGRKIHSKMDLGSHLQMDALNEKRFKTEFKKTGKTRKSVATGMQEAEYIGKIEDGRTVQFWLAPSPDVCLPPGRFDAFGFYNLGYLSLDGITYLTTEITGPDFALKITGISDGSYQFNPAGYQRY